MLDNVIDLNFYPTAEAKNSNLKHRPIGLGLMGLHDVLHRMNISIDSDKAIEFNERLFQEYSHNAILSSSLLAEERGAYETYEGSLWSQDIFPIDSWKNLMKYRHKRPTISYSSRLLSRPRERQGARYEKFQCHGHSAHGHHRIILME